MFFFVLTSCSRKIIYYNDVTLIHTVYGVENKSGFKLYVPESNSYIDDDSLEKMTIRKQNGHCFEITQHTETHIPDYTFNYEDSVVTVRNRNNLLILEVKKDTFQILNDLPIPKNFLSMTISNDEFLSPISNYSYRTEYIRDTLMIFNTYQPQLAHLFHLYPITSDSSQNKYSDPIKVGFLKGLGVPVFIEVYSFLVKGRQVKLNCRDISEVKFATKKSVFKYLK